MIIEDIEVFAVSIPLIKPYKVAFGTITHARSLVIKILTDTNEIPIPEVVTFGEENDVAFLVLKFIKSSGKSENFWDDFGKRLANLHQHSNDYFGLDHDNYIGSLHQSNRKHDNWSDFFREERLDFQVRMARDHGNAGNDTVRAFDRFYRKLDEIFPVEKTAP